MNLRAPFNWFWWVSNLSNKSILESIFLLFVHQSYLGTCLTVCEMRGIYPLLCIWRFEYKYKHITTALARNYRFLTNKNITQFRKRFITPPKYPTFWWNKNYDLLLRFLLSKFVFHFGYGPCWPPFLPTLGSKIVAFRGFSNFSELIDCNSSY